MIKAKIAHSKLQSLDNILISEGLTNPKNMLKTYNRKLAFGYDSKSQLQTPLY